MCCEQVCQIRLSLGPRATIGVERSSGRGRAVETVVERPAALDVHKAHVTACAGVPDRRGRRESTWRSSRPRFAVC
jgi:hypothetical protein